MLYINYLPFLLFLYWVLPARFAFYIIFLSVYLLSSLRTGYGPDYYSYYEIYQSLKENPLEIWNDKIFKDQEFLFRFLSSMIKYLSFDYRSYLFIISFMILAPIFYIFNKSPKNFFPIFIYLTFFYQAWAFSGLRQALALSLSFCAFYMLANKGSKIKSIMIIITAIGFHYSAVISLICFPFLNRAYPIKKYIIFILSLVIFAQVFSGYIFDLVFLTPFENRILFYLNNNPEVSLLKASWRTFLFVMVLAFYLMLGYRLSDFDRKIIQFFLFFFPIFLLFQRVEIVSTQISIYPFMLLCFIPSILSRCLISKSLKILLFILFINGALFYYYSVLNYTLFASEANMDRLSEILIK